MDGNDIFSRTARAHARNRMMLFPPEDRWLVERMARELAERLEITGGDVQGRALLIGQGFGPVETVLKRRGISWLTADPGFGAAQVARGIQCDEDFLPFGDASFDVTVVIGTLDTINDLPGALLLIRRALKPGGLFLGAMTGAGSLPSLRQLLLSGQGPAVQRIHPQVDVRAAGDLLARAGLGSPVADCETIDARYRNGGGLIRDLRANGLTNQLKARAALPRAAADAIMALQDFTEQFAIVYLTGFAPEALPGNR